MVILFWSKVGIISIIKESIYVYGKWNKTTDNGYNFPSLSNPTSQRSGVGFPAGLGNKRQPTWAPASHTGSCAQPGLWHSRGENDPFIFKHLALGRLTSQMPACLHSPVSAFPHPSSSAQSWTMPQEPDELCDRKDSSWHISLNQQLWRRANKQIALWCGSEGNAQRSGSHGSPSPDQALSVTSSWCVFVNQAHAWPGPPFPSVFSIEAREHSPNTLLCMMVFGGKADLSVCPLILRPYSTKEILKNQK